MNKTIWQLILVFIVSLSLHSPVNAQWIKQQVINPSDSGVYLYPTSVQFSDANTGYLAGGSYSFSSFPGAVYKTTNSGANWYRISPDNAFYIRELEIANPLTLFASCDSGQVIRTLTGGNTWTVLNTPAVPTTQMRWRISFVNALTGWISTDNALVTNKTYQTTNGGTTWTSVNAANGFSKIKFFSGTNGYGINRSGFFVSTNSGSSWVNTMSDSLLTEFYFLNNNTGWLYSKKSSQVSSIKGKSWKTTNGGLNWALLYSNDTSGKAPSNVKFFDETTGYANYYAVNQYPSGIVKTTNGGTTWFNPSDYRLLTEDRTMFSFFTDQSTGYTGTEYDYLYKTTTGIGNLVNPFFADYYKYQNSNNINNYTNAYAQLTSSRGNNTPGFEYPKGSNNYCLFNSSIAISGVVNGDTLLSESYSFADFHPGKYDGAGNETGSRLGEYGLYQIKTGDGTGVPDWDRWPVSQGAPVNGSQPLLTGNQSTFLTVTDAVRGTSSFSPVPLKAEMKIYSYSFNDDLRKDAIYYKIDITNKNSAAWSNAYISLIVDPDIGTVTSDDKMGSDSALGIAYGYNGVLTDPGYGNTSPAVGYKFISATNGFTLTSCVPFYNPGSGTTSCIQDPSSVPQFRNYQKGFNRCGEAYLYQSLPRKFVYNGDPQTNSGWNSALNADARFFMNLGPSSLAPGETASVIVAVIVARGAGSLNSVTKLKQYAAVLPVAVLPVSSVIPKEFKLNQSFPNPFNPVTKISYSVPVASFVNLNVYDISGRLVKNLFSGRHAEGNYEVDFNGESLSSGVYICRMNSENYTNSIKMILVK